MTPSSSNEEPKGVWLANLLRISAFPSATAEIDSSNWWVAVVGEPAESQVLLPKKRLSREEGPLGSGRLILETQPTRIDWVFSKTLDGDALGHFTIVTEQFASLMDRWFDIFDSIQRLAFGAILSFSVNSKTEGYERLQSFLKRVQLDPQNSSDFLYQINRPRTFKHDDFEIRINRLSKWTVALSQTLEISPESNHLISSQYACNLDLDINTDAEFKTELPKELLNDIFRVFIEYAMEISSEGDIP